MSFLGRVMTRPVQQGLRVRSTWHAALVAREGSLMLALLALAATISASHAPLDLPWTSLLDAEGKASVPPVALERLETSRQPARRITGRVHLGDGSAAAGLRIAAVPVEPSLFAQHAALLKAPPAATILAPGSDALVAAKALAIASSDHKGNFALVIDDGAWSVAACEPSGWCSRAVVVLPPSDVPQPPLDLTARRRRFVALEVRDDLGAMVPGARVVARSRPDPAALRPRDEQPLASVVTDPSGRALLADLPLTPLDIEVAAPGLARAVIDPLGDGLLALTLPRLATVSAVLVADDGEPLIEPAAVVMFPPEFADSSRRWTQQGDVGEADADGRVILRDVPPGRLVVEARAKGRFPATSRILEARPGQQVAAGQITLVRGAMIGGIVRDALRRDAIAGAEVRVAGRDDSVVADQDGRFEIGPLAPGTWQLMARHDDYPALPGDRVEVVVKDGDETRDDVELTLTPGGDLTVLVRNPDGQPVAGARVRITGSQVHGDGLEVRADANGEARWENLPAGSMTVTVAGWNSTAPTLTIQPGIVSISDAPADPSSERAPTIVTIVPAKRTVADVRVGGVTLFGTVTVGGVATPARVVPRSVLPQAAGSAEPSPEYVLAGVPAGHVKVFVETFFDGPEAGTYRRFARTPHEVDIPPDVSAFRHDIALPAPAAEEPAPKDGVRVPGTMVDAATREPLAGWFVQVSGVGMFPTGADGRFELLLPQNGRVDAVPRSSRMRGEQDDGMRSVERTPLITIDGLLVEPPPPVVIEVSSGPSVTLRVIDRAGRRMAGVTCSALADPPRYLRHSARVNVTNPLGNAVLRVEEPGDASVLVTDGASFRTIVGPVRFGVETERVVNVPPTGTLRLIGVTNATALQCDEWPVPLPALKFGWDHDPLASTVTEGGVVTLVQRGLPAGDCRVVTSAGMRAVRIIEGETVTADLR